jgi:two-component system NtrC family sensor kinase
MLPVLLPGWFTLPPRHPAVIGLLAVGLIVSALLFRFLARRRLSHQVRMLESERAQLYESVMQLQKMAAIGRLAAGIAHQINNPLAIIQAQVGILSDLIGATADFSHAAEFKERVTKIRLQIERMRKLSHRILDFSRQVAPELEPVDVVAALEQTVGFVEKDLESARVQVVRRFASDLPSIRSSLAQIQQVFLNLINNALDVLGEGGELRLSAECSNGGIAVTIADNGPGIPEKDLPRIFEPFFSTKSGDGNHAGLGLGICRDIMRNLEGRISVSSEAGSGAEFSVWFPLEISQ